MLVCQSPFDAEPALLTYQPDELASGALRTWKSCKRFADAPPAPIEVTVDEGESGVLLELYDATIALMSRRLAEVLKAAGVSNVDFYDVVVDDLETKQKHLTHMAFNIVGGIAAADLSKSTFSAPDGPMISVDFDVLSIDDQRVRGALFFRLAESINGIVVHERIKNAIEAANIETLTFLPPEQWVG